MYNSLLFHDTSLENEIQNTMKNTRPTTGSDLRTLAEIEADNRRGGPVGIGKIAKDILDAVPYTPNPTDLHGR